jgi:hypothetical protein
VEETKKPQSNQDPAPLNHSDAERVTGKEADGGQDRAQSSGERDGTDADGENA